MRKKRFFLTILFSLMLLASKGAAAQNYFWENPVRVSQSGVCFPSAVSNGKIAAAIWQEVDAKKSSIYLTIQFYKNGKWDEARRFAGPFPYSGEVPDLYSAAMNSNGVLAVSVLSDANTISVITSFDAGATFTQKKFSKQNLPLVAPRIYDTASGAFIVFTSLGRDESFTMLYARSRDGINWNDFSEFSPAQKSLNPFLPVLLSTPKGELVVFQAQYRTQSRIVYKLFSTLSFSGGSSWSNPVMLTTGPESDLSSDQRPTLFRFEQNNYIAWERTPYNSENSSVYFAQLNSDGNILGRTERISNSGNANRPILFSHNNHLSLVWFDTRSGLERVYLTQRQGTLWGEQEVLSPQRSAATFVYPMIADDGKTLAFVWQGTSGKSSWIYRLESDHTVLEPTIMPLNFVAGQRSREEGVRFRITMPTDSSGIRGYSWLWTQDPNQDAPTVLMNLPKENTLSLKATAEKNWYLKVRAVDYAGNWSDSAVVSYYRDLTPPRAPVIAGPQIDAAGFAQSNSLDFSWRDDSEDEVIDGYSYSLERVESLPREFNDSKRHPTSLSQAQLAAELSEYKKKNPESALRPKAPVATVQTRTSAARFANRKNGVYTFSVRSIDKAGNVSEPAFVTVYANKYEPFTRVDSVRKNSDVFGSVSLELHGAGFRYDGTIYKIVISREKTNEPYSIEFNLKDGDFSVPNDEKISGLKLDNTVPQGTYSISLYHSDRGLYKAASAFEISENGTVKIAANYVYKPSWQRVYDTGKFFTRTGDILFAIILIIALGALIFAARGLALSAKEAVLVKKEINALLSGDIMPLEKKKRIQSLNVRGTSLKLKLMSFTAMIVFMAILLVSLPLGYVMTRSQERTLSVGLEERVNVLLSSIASGARAYMPTQNVLELSALPEQSAAISEASFVSIAGLSSNDENSSGLDFLWASNDSDLASKIDTEILTPGVSKITDPTMLAASEICQELNQAAAQSAGVIARNIASLNAEGASIALKSDPVSVKRREEISVITTELSTRLSRTLNEMSEAATGSFPEYNSALLDRENTEYLFYRPVLYRQGTSQTYARAIVFISVSTASLIQTIDGARRTIVYTALAVSLFAVLIGIIASWVLASVIVSPIKRLASHVVMIGNTVNKEKLAGKEIVIKSRDEIGQLGDSVNEMTRDLVKAAQDEHLAMDGKVVQRAFLPLTPDESGSKQTVAILNDKNFQCFGYYEGASEVSGDYFDYKKLDENHYIMIKCDASGHGVPAALIMTVVATLFRKYYENWSPKKAGGGLDALVTQINDFIESLGIKGKFATLILALVDTATGDVSLCNAGDNIVHIYDAAAKKQKTLTLQETPAAGPLPTFMVQMKGGFKIEKTRLNKGDVLFLYTDGIEESTRKFRDQEFNVTKCEETVDVKDGVHANHKVGSESEQMENERIQEIIEAVLNKQKYVLKKYHNPIPNEVLEFDFTNCTGSTEEVILALCSVEKVFRFYKPQGVGEKDTVRVDRRIDAFLKEHFNLYDYYCSNKDDEQADNIYLHYSFLREDEQLDDLTLLAAKIG
ncbi:MAG: SpoIIE family protein phosphatase [Treponema sp.]|nr:SpoIIE family protein phosphatase [Treponema sp.]